MNSIHFILQPLPATDEQFNERLRELSEKIHKCGYGTHRAFDQLKTSVKEVVIGPSHIGILLEDGKAFRVAFSLNPDRMDLSKSDASKSNSSTVHINTIPNKNTNVSATSRPRARSRALLMRTNGGRAGSGGQGSGSRSSGVIIGGSGSSRPLVTTVPATYVPEELISQAEVVLQGKSRNLIIRELQRTNLDVNLAVNNLLSRDDEEAEDTEDGGDNYVPEDLISLLDNGFHGENSSVIIDPSDGLFSEEIFGNYSSIRNLLFDRIRSERNQSNTANSEGSQSRTPTSSSSVINSNSLSAQLSSVSSDREAFSRWRDRQYYGPRRWMNKEEFSLEKETDSKKKEMTSTSPIWISEELQPWPEVDNLKFKKIAALYSEFIAISDSGELHQWKWSDPEPFKSESEGVFHPKALSLNINEKVEHIAANFIRCTVVTENNRVATWIDEQLGYLGLKLEHSALLFNEFILDPIVSVDVCSLYSAVRTENNNIYWWGVLPFEQRRCLWEKFRSKAKKPFKSSTTDISVGSVVVMKKCPIYQTGSIGFTCANGIPKVGQLLNSVWDFNDVSRFKILNISSILSDKPSNTTAVVSEKETNKTVHLTTNICPNSSNKTNSVKESTDRIDMPPPPSPASSTCSDTGSVTSHKRTKRLATKDDDNKRDEEIWQLKDVIFVEDKIGPVGKVLKVDGDFVAVRFPVPSANLANDGKEDDWQQCRLLRREDIQIFKSAANTRGPDWIQKTPKKINISHGNDNVAGFQILSLAVDTRGIHIIKKIGTKIHYCLFNLYNGKQEQNCLFPTDGLSFISSTPNNITTISEETCVNSSTIILLDGNRTLYPVLKDCIGTIKDPHWFDLPPIKSFTMSTICLSNIAGNNLKSKVSVAALLIENQKLMPHILRSDLKNVFSVLNRIEKDETNDFLSLIFERCDGCRNIFHAAAFMCAPTSNKDLEEKKNPSPNPPTTRPSGSTSPFINSFSNTSGSDIGTNSGSNCNGSAYPNIPNNLSSTNNREGRTVTLREMMMNSIINNFSESSNNSNNASNVDDHLYLSSWSGETSNVNDNSTTSNVEDDILKIMSPGTSTSTKMSGQISTDPLQKREHAILILQQMCSSPKLRPYLQQLLCAKDAQGMTPFMLSVSSRAYEAGIILLNTILSMSENDEALKESLIFPVGSPPDQSPLYVICYNDTCSFTWTGADHINQNIYECKTCGLTGSLCCCTECARVCHKGHDCKLKRTSPTAYCDCWEKCKCKALIAGNQTKRFALLSKLISCTDLVSKFNSKGESILLFLIQTVGRQIIEQRQYRANSRARNVASSSNNSTSQNRKSSTMEVDSDMPEHDLEPPKFARKALEYLLNDWEAVKSMIMAGAEKSDNTNNLPNAPESCSNSESYNVYLQTQNGSTLLDKFTHNLFVKCTSEHLDILLGTLTREMNNSTVSKRIEEAEEVARRFVRSVTRVFVIFNLEKLPNPEKKKSNYSSNKHMQNCIKVFQSLIKISIEELCEAAEALIAPVRLGTVRPTAPFPMSSSSNDNSDDLFCVDPLAPSNMEAASETMDQTTEHDQTSEFSLHRNYSTEASEALREANEGDDSTNNTNNAHIPEEEMLGSARTEEAMHDDESDNDFPFNDGETDSDSDDNQSNQDAQRSAQTGATMVSETDESGDSSPQDEEASDDGETDDQSDEFSFNEQQLERQGNSSSNRAGESAPQSMQWAIRSRETGRSSVRVPPGSSLVFIDPVALRRSAVPSSTTVAPPPQDLHTMSTTASNLSRGFSIILRQISELLGSMTSDTNTSKFTNEEVKGIHVFVEKRLKPTWDWMFSVMDSTEAQLKFGAYLTNYTDPAHPLHPLNLSSHGNTNQSNSSGGVNVTGSTSRRDFFSYCLSLMRAHTFEHRDSLPVLDVTALRHIAYVLDGFIYYMRYDAHFYERTNATASVTTYQAPDYEDTDEELSNIEEPVNDVSNNLSANYYNISSLRRNSFFVRSDSTLSLGSLAHEGFDLPVDVSLPLADKPHLLQPNSKRQELFNNKPLSAPKLNSTDPSSKDSTNLSIPPIQLGVSQYEYLNRRAVISNFLESPVEETMDVESQSLAEDNMDDDLNQQSSSSTANRPEIIVSIDTNKKTNQSASSVLRSVIVRAGSSSDDFLSKEPEISMESGSKNTNRIEGPQAHFLRGCLFCKNIKPDSEFSSWNFLLGRWKLTLELFGRVFLDDVGMEHGSILPELRGFPVKENRFRRHMEKLRNGQQRDLILCKLERNRDSLIIQTFKELNTQFGSQNRRIHPPLTFNRVKVTFKDEPGEGSGVARSFYTSISEALLASAKMPNLETVQVGANNKLGVPFSSILRNRSGSVRDMPSLPRRGVSNKMFWRSNKEKKALNYEARPYIPSPGNDNSDNPNDHLSVHLQQLGERLYPRVSQVNQEHASKITGMLLEIPAPQLLSILTSEEMLRQKVMEALEIINCKQKMETSSSNQQKKTIPVVLLDQCQVEDNEPLFYSPGKRGFYTPCQGFGSFERLNAFRNIGRLIGLCLLQNELLPLYLQRHVLKYILGRKIKFHDLAFFDPVLYESLRQLIQTAQSENSEEIFNRMDLYFSIDLRKEEGGGSVELAPSGREMQVTPSNVLDYIKRYTEYRLIKSQEKALEAIKDGVFDVLPDSCMNNLTSEDLRLLLNGVGDINVSTLISYTSFNDESSEIPDKLLKFKRWFWSIVEKMNVLERQDLVYFWTGSPALPASEEGFQPLPSVTIRPADDSHLPTANTCISRLYIPLYSSKAILRNKLLMAIKSKNFGFV